MKIGYVGLGRMGRGMAANLVRGGQEVIVFDRVSAAVEAMTALGAEAASSLADLAARADVVCLSLPGPAQIEEVVFGEDGLRAHLRPGTVMFDFSTNSRELVLRMHEALGEQGVTVLDAPVSGGPAGSESGDLAFWVGGDAHVYETHEHLLRAMGDKPKYCGPIGAGTVVKLVNNMTGFMFLSSMAESFSLAVKAGVDPLLLWDALRLGVIGKQSALNMLTKQFLPGDFDTPAFALELAFKDAALATQLGRDLGVPMRLSNMVAAEMTEALGKGWGSRDTRAFLKLQLDRAGVSIQVDPAEIEKIQNESTK